MFKSKSKSSWLVLFCIFCVCCVGCFPKTFSRSDKILYSYNQVLQSAKSFRVTALQSAAVYYKQGLLTEDKKVEIIELGDQLQDSINSSANALIVYQQLGSIGEADVEIQIKEFEQIFEQFTNLVAPLIKTKGD